MGLSYKYDSVIQLSKIFTYLEEITIVNHLRTWEEESKSDECKCRLCALIHLSKLAHQFAKEKNTYPKKWDEKAKLEWLYE
ncbi:unnamed protein product [Lasius platythorax]|uniref:Uncharacterized protein n=1 Tax=Lasius platythorax TaxID=488582 RepID=A0AAV2NM55_9HYME